MVAETDPQQRGGGGDIARGGGIVALAQMGDGGRQHRVGGVGCGIAAQKVGILRVTQGCIARLALPQKTAGGLREINADGSGVCVEGFYRADGVDGPFHRGGVPSGGDRCLEIRCDDQRLRRKRKTAGESNGSPHRDDRAGEGPAHIQIHPQSCPVAFPFEAPGQTARVGHQAGYVSHQQGSGRKYYTIRLLLAFSDAWTAAAGDLSAECKICRQRPISAASTAGSPGAGSAPGRAPTAPLPPAARPPRRPTWHIRLS